MFSCNEKAKESKGNNLDSYKTLFDCEKEKISMRLQSGIISKKELEAKIKELYRDKFVNNPGLFEILINDPVSDETHDIDNKKFLTIGVRDNFELNYSQFKALISKKVMDGYSDFTISFVNPTEELLKVLSKNLSLQDQNNIKIFENNLYVLMTFKGRGGRKDVTYLMFNLEKEYDITKDVDLGDLYVGFATSGTAKTIKTNLSTTYIPYGIKYDLRKVQDYLNRVDNYFTQCDPKEILKLKFDVCFGTSNKDKESIYLTSIPEDKSGPLTDFPYYDQGSLEP